MSRCCHVDCSEESVFEIQWDPPSPDNYTESCEAHVGMLLGHHPGDPKPEVYRVYPT